MLGQQPAPELVGILAGGRRHLVDERLGDVAVDGAAHRAPEAVRHARIGLDVLDPQVRDVVGQVRRALDRDRIDAAHLLERVRVQLLHQRRLHDALLPCRRRAIGVERRPHPDVGDRPVVVVLDVVFPAPHHLHRRADLLRRFHGVSDEVALAAPAETAAHVRRVHEHLVLRQARHRHRHLLRHRLRLRRQVDVAAVGGDVGGAVHRLHAGVGQVGRLEHALDRLGALGERRVEVAVLARRRRRASAPVRHTSS